MSSRLRATNHRAGNTLTVMKKNFIMSKKDYSLTIPNQFWPEWVRLGISAIPYIGSPLSTYLGSKRQKKVKERIENYFSYITDELNRIDEDKLDKEFLESEEFGELFARGAEEASRSTTSERIRRFANIIINGALGTIEARQRSGGLFTIVNRLSDIDSFVLLSFGPPCQESFRAESKDKAINLINSLANYLNVEIPNETVLIESIIYMDNLGVTWVTQKEESSNIDENADSVKEFSVFRSQLGTEVAKAITPPDFFKAKSEISKNPQWPKDFVSKRFENTKSKI
jgi:hypothetical protein